MENETARLALNNISQVASILLAVVSICIAWIALRFTAKPRVLATLLDIRSFTVDERAVLTFHLRNAGHWYARPPATGIRVWVNMDPAFAPVKLRYGSDLELEDARIKKGKGGNKYFMAKGIILYRKEPGESLELTAVMPNTPGRYRVYLSIHTAEGGASSYDTTVEVRTT